MSTTVAYRYVYVDSMYAYQILDYLKKKKNTPTFKNLGSARFFKMFLKEVFYYHQGWNYLINTA